MKLTDLKNLATKSVSRPMLIGKKHSPTILFAAGVVGIVGTVVLATRATLKLEEVLEDINKDMEKAKFLHETVEDETYDNSDYQRDMALLYVRSTVKVAKLYALPIALGALSIAALTGSHYILSQRNAALVAAYGAIEKGYAQYRKRVVDEFGEEKDRELRYGIEETEVIETKADGKTVTKKVKGLPNKNVSEYAVFFDETSKSWQREANYNKLFVQCQQNYANDLLRARGHLTLNEVYDMLGVPRTKAGFVVGWVMGKGGDDFVDFGVFRGDTFMGQEFVNGNERSILLDFNVDGVIYDKI